MLKMHSFSREAGVEHSLERHEAICIFKVWEREGTKCRCGVTAVTPQVRACLVEMGRKTPKHAHGQ